MEHINTLRSEKRSMKNLLVDALKMISDSGNPLISKIITYFGATAGIGGGSYQAIVGTEVVKNTPVVNDIVNACASASPDWLVYIPAVGVISLVIKNTTDVIFRRIEHKKIMNEKSTDKDNLC
jgi:hypothetical protein